MKAMQQFKDFIETVEEDPRIRASHISLYCALLYEYLNSTCPLSFEVKRNGVLRKAKMCRKTYNKCMKELREYGYINYKASSDPLKKAQVFLTGCKN